MADSSWDNGGGTRPQRRGWPLWGKLLMGCGVVVLVGVVACVAGIATCTSAITKAGDSEWNAMGAVVRQLQSEAGAKAVYAANPGLTAAYRDEATFLQSVQVWRPRLEPLPAQMPSVFTGRVSMNVSVSGGYRKVELGYTNGKSLHMATRWENGRLMDLSVN